MRKKIAVLVGQPEETYQTTFLEGLFQRAFAEDFDVCVLAMFQKHPNTETREAGEANIFSLAQCDLFEAIVVLANTIQVPGLLERIEEELHQYYKKTVVFIDQQSKYFPSISADNRLPMKKLISHLIEVHGYRDIAFLTGNEYHPHARERLQSFLECMQEHGLKVPQNRIFYGDFWYNSGESTAEKLLQDREHLPQAVACANDFMAIGLIRRLKSEGVNVPQDIAVTGYDASIMGKREEIPLTSMPVPAQEIGTYCIDFIIAELEGKSIPAFASAAELFVGRSCGCEPEPMEAYEEGEKWEHAKPPLFDTTLGVMEDDLLLQAQRLDFMNTVFSYVKQIRPFEGFHLCLNEEWASDDFSEEPGGEYTARMVDALRCGVDGRGSDKVDLTALFDRKLLLPEFAEDGDKPRAYYFSPLFFERHCIGYAAVNYGETIRCYGEAYRRWLAALVRGLESYLRVAVLKEKNKQLEISQIRDSKTGLYNYRGFLNKIIAELKEWEGSYSYVNIVVIELLGLHELYMKFGSRLGDKVLNDFAQMLLQSGSQESLCYLGNSEFLALRISQEEAEGCMDALLEHMLPKLDQYCNGNALEGKLSMTFGKMQGPVDSEEKLGSLIGEAVGRKNANKLKAEQRRQKGMTAEEQKKTEIVADILDHNRLIYFFQPIVRTDTGEIYAYEALMRANVQEKISPLDILKAAEYLGRLDDVERATFFNVLSYVEDHPEQFENKKVFINSIPGTQMAEKDADVIREKMTKLSGQIVVELTEQAELDDEQLEELKKKYEKLGVETAVDDYGTGYSNVYNLLRYMPKVVKIDRMLLANIQLSAQKQHFVKEIIEFSHNNNITVLAEGVETMEELQMVITLGSDLIQGYYTGRPAAEVVQKIDHKIQSEIVQFGQYVQERNQRKVFQAGQNDSIYLIRLATGHYSKIRFSPGNVPHRDVNIIGLPGFQANMEIEIEDGFTGSIKLQDADLAIHNDKPVIHLGKNCDVTLVLSGENILEKGGILVSESSKLTVRGNGNLRILQIAVNGYGIGNSAEEKCGELYFDQDGRIEISGNTLRGVGIGGGLGGEIRINRGMYVLQLAGEEAVGIGSLDADTKLSIKSCAIELGLRNGTSIGIGSLKGNAEVEIRHSHVSGVFNASRCIGIGTLEGNSFSLQLGDSVAELSGRSECMCGIGSLSGNAEIGAENFALTINVDGRESIAMGNHTKTARIRTRNGDLVCKVRNQLDYDIGAELIELTNGHSEFMLNGENVVREVIAGEM